MDSIPRTGSLSLNAFVGFIVGLAGGLVGLGGAELRGSDSGSHQLEIAAGGSM